MVDARSKTKRSIQSCDEYDDQDDMMIHNVCNYKDEDWWKHTAINSCPDGETVRSWYEQPMFEH